jgi:cytidylate kinase
VVQDKDVARGVVAIDGPSGSGKSTVARGVATRLEFGYLDTGAMYRALTWLVLQRGPALDQLAACPDELAELMTSSRLVLGSRPDQHRVQVAGHDVTEVIRGSEVTAAVSAVAAVPQVRSYLGALQRQLAAEAVADRGGMVMEGRDIGTAIFPEARLKIWLTATPEARGQRRAAEVEPEAASAEGESPAAVTTVDSVVEQLAHRDRLDSTRQVSPAHCAQDARVIDTTPFTAEQVIDQVVALWDTIVLPDAPARAEGASRSSNHSGAGNHSPAGSHSGGAEAFGQQRQDTRTGASG